MDHKDLKRMLAASLADHWLSDEEQEQFRSIRSGMEERDERALRNLAFDLAEKSIRQNPEASAAVLKWLKRVIHALPLQKEVRASAHFSPGPACLNKILELCSQAKRRLDVCVFTISDNRISRALMECHQRAVDVRIITDDVKQADHGSDIAWFREEGIPVRIDSSPKHMHHKFLLADETWLLTGSFNWTASATEGNQENVIVTNHPGLISSFSDEFERLWDSFFISSN